MTVVVWFIEAVSAIALLYYFGNVAREQRDEWARIDCEWTLIRDARERNSNQFTAQELSMVENARSIYDQDLVESVARVDCDEASVINPSGDAGDSFGGAAA